MVLGKHFIKYYWKYLLFFLLGAAALIVVDYAQLLIPDVVGNIIDGMNGQSLTKDILIGYVWKMVMVAGVVFVGRFLWRICIFGNGVKIETDIRNDLFKKMEKLSTTYLSTSKTGALMALYTNDLGTIRQSFAGGTLMLVDALSLGIIALIKMLKINGLLVLSCVIPLIFVSIFATLIESKITKRVDANLKAYSDMSDYVQEDFTGISVIKAYVKEKRKEFLFGDHNQANSDTCMDFVRLQVKVNITIGLVLGIVRVLILLCGGIIIYVGQVKGNDSMTVGELITFSAYFGSLIWPAMAVGELINLRGQSKASEKRISELLDAPEEINDSKMDASLELDTCKGDIEFKHLNFTYPNTDAIVLKDITFKIKPGEMVGVMGATGCGKTTIMELLERLYNVEEEKIFIDGNDIMKLPIKYVRDSIAYVPQETFLFKQTIDENIAFSCGHVDEEKTHAAAIVAGVAKDVEGFGEKYHTVLGERGVTVSGGQKQRISIARALMKDAPILILDDSLSAVDTATEELILNSLRDIRKGKTTIIIAHRITTLQTLDKIIVMDDTKISDVGTHEYLLEHNDIYKNEVRLQELEKEMEAL